MDKSLVARLEVKEVDEAARTFSGLAATWDQDLGGDIIEKGAFKRTLRHWKQSKRPLPLLDSHQAFSSVRAVVGKLLEAEETDEGLDTKFEVIGGPDGDEVFRRVKGGYVDGLSIGYNAVKVKYPESEEERNKGIFRYLQEVKLREISVVLFPMNPNARISTETAKAMLLNMAAKEQLDPEEICELQALQAHIGKLLAKAAPPAPTPEPAAPEYDAHALGSKLEAVMAARLVTRVREARHLGAMLQL